MTDAAKESPLAEALRRAPSPLNGLRAQPRREISLSLAGVRGEASRSPHESGEDMERCDEAESFIMDSIVAPRLKAAHRVFRRLKPTAAIMASRCESVMVASN